MLLLAGAADLPLPKLLNFATVLVAVRKFVRFHALLRL
jgi:hypothetical protein